VPLHHRLYVAAVIVLVVGLAGAVAIWLTASDAPVEAYQYVVVDGKAYPIAGSQSKAYVRQLERFGGKASVLFAELGTWLAGLWRGKALAITVGWITLFAFSALSLVAFWLSPPSDPDG
jgi:hypothetical protein